MSKIHDRVRELRHHSSNLSSVSGAQCHVMVAETAKKLAAAFYEECAKRSNSWYAKFPKQEDFVNKQWGLWLKLARQALAEALKSETLDQDQKEKIVEALLLDNTLVKGRRDSIQIH